MSNKKDKTEKTIHKTEKTTKKRVFSSLFRREKKTSVSVGGIKLPSAARLSHKPQVSDLDLSYSAKHLLLLIQYQLDAERIKIYSSGVSWDMLVEFNKEVKLKAMKNLVKEFMGIHRFSSHELQTIADRVRDFLYTHQPHNVVSM
ncbi:MAG: hypothetical protein WCL18_05765 [bacterium]